MCAPKSTAPDLEPWLRGLTATPNPVAAHLVRAADHICEDAAIALGRLTALEAWATPHGMTSAGFHAKHLAGSTRRLCAYLEGRPLDESELAEARAESQGNEEPVALLERIRDAFSHYVSLVLALSPEAFDHVREVGRKRIPVTAVSLAIHIAEHGQRHVGQLVSGAKLVEAGR